MTLPPSAPEALARSLGAAERLLVVLDFDGTIAPIVDHPDQAEPAQGALPALRRLAEATTVMMISGRPLTELSSHLGSLPVILAGGHGAQIREVGGRVEDLVDIQTLTSALDIAHREVLRLVTDGAGWLVERKPTSLAVHHRLVPSQEEEQLLPRVRAQLEQHLTDAPGFDLLTGKSVVELRPRGVDKGHALGIIADRHPTLIPVMIGDDITDEDAFEVATARGGQAILVAERSRTSRAGARLKGPDEVVALIDLLATGPRGDTDVS